MKLRIKYYALSASQILDLMPSNIYADLENFKLPKLGTVKSDQDALAQDWVKVGRDFKAAMRVYDQTNYSGK